MPITSQGPPDVSTVYYFVVYVQTVLRATTAGCCLVLEPQLARVAALIVGELRSAENYSLHVISLKAEDPREFSARNTGVRAWK